MCGNQNGLKVFQIWEASVQVQFFNLFSLKKDVENITRMSSYKSYDEMKGQL